MLSAALKQVLCGEILSEEQAYETFLVGLSEEVDPKPQMPFESTATSEPIPTSTSQSALSIQIQFIQ